MKAALIALTFIAGILNTIQAGSNSTLNKTLHSPLWSMAVVFTVALVSTLLAALVTGQRPPSTFIAAGAPWWAWIGGVFGALYIFSMMKSADQLGAAVFMGITVTMAVLTSLVMDHYGLLGFDEHRAGVGRIVGGLLMIVGLALIARF